MGGCNMDGKEQCLPLLVVTLHRTKRVCCYLPALVQRSTDMTGNFGVLPHGAQQTCWCLPSGLSCCVGSCLA